MARKKSTKVSNMKVLEAAMESRVRKVIVIGEDSHGRQYVVASGPQTLHELEDQIVRTGEALAMLRRVRDRAKRAK